MQKNEGDVYAIKMIFSVHEKTINQKKLKGIVFLKLINSKRFSQESFFRFGWLKVSSVSGSNNKCIIVFDRFNASTQVLLKLSAYSIVQKVFVFFYHNIGLVLFIYLEIQITELTLEIKNVLFAQINLKYKKTGGIPTLLQHQESFFNLIFNGFTKNLKNHKEPCQKKSLC